VVFEVDGQPVKSAFRSWSLLKLGPRKGERVPVLYQPTEPSRVAIDSFIQRYFGLVFPPALAIAVAYWAGVFRLRRNSPVGRDLQA
jgi:hypothetical protein